MTNDVHIKKTMQFITKTTVIVHIKCIIISRIWRKITGQYVAHLGNNTPNNICDKHITQSSTRAILYNHYETRVNSMCEQHSTNATLIASIKMGTGNRQNKFR